MKTAFIPIALMVFTLTSCGEEASGNDPVAVHVAMQSQEMNDEQFSRGEEYLAELKEMAADRSAPLAQTKAKNRLAGAGIIDQLCEKQIRLLDNLRSQLMSGLGEKVSPVGGVGSVLTDIYANSSRPDVYNLFNVKYVGKTDFLSDHAEQIRSSMLQLRRELIKVVVASASDENHVYSYIPPAIGKFKDAKELYKLLAEDMREAKISPDETESVFRLYCGLSYSDSYWNEVLHADCSWESVFGFLTGLQSKVLKARNNALAVIYMRIGCNASYGFNQIAVCTLGPEYVKAGEEVSFDVFIAAYDSYLQPKVELSGGNANVVVRDGKATVTLKAPKAAEMELAGTITIFNKSGIPKTLPWRKKIVIGK